MSGLLGSRPCTGRVSVLLALRHMAMVLLAGLCAVQAASAAGPITLVPAQSQVTFVARQMAVPVEGRFRAFDARVVLDPKQPEAGSVSLTIEMASAGFGLADVDAELQKPDWFDVRKYPRASFESSRVRAQGGSRFEVAGKLTIKGIAKDVVVPVTLVPFDGGAAAVGEFTLQRKVFKIGDGEWSDTAIVGDEVRVKFKLALRGIDRP